MKNQFAWRALGAAMLAVAGVTVGCGGGGSGGGAVFIPPTTGSGSGTGSSTSVKIVDAGPNAVSTWSETAITTINLPAATSGTEAEVRPNDTLDLTTVHLAMYDALMIITGTYKPFYVTQVAGSSGGEISQPAAVAAAAYGVLKVLFPSRSAQYQGTYDSFVAGVPDGDPKVRGLAVGAQVAAGVLAARANDGRSVALPPYVPGTAPGKFRGVNPINRNAPYIKPFALNTVSQFRPPPPFALDSADYAKDFEETRTLGGTVSSLRTADQLEIARFHTEAPPQFWPRNIRRFARTDRSLADQARLLAMVSVAQADATLACFEAKYFYEFWRPYSAINLADTDGNPLTSPDPTWTPVVPTPNHPEYPAAHACNAGSVMGAIKSFFGTDQIEYSFDSTVTGTTHNFTTTQGLVDEIRVARIYGGMHFRNSTMRGEELGLNVVQWMLANRFQRN